jgi:hypothetical protein
MPAAQSKPCPICRQPAARENSYFPFCSERCKLIDLGAWAAEGYRIKGEKIEDESAATDKSSSGQEE